MTLVSIFGDFDSSILPLIYEFRNKIKRHILLYDLHKRNGHGSMRIQTGLERLRKKYKLSFDQMEIEIDEDSKTSILRVLDDLFRLVDEPGELHLNATDGLANVAIVMGSEILKRGGVVLAYDIYENEYNRLEGDRMERCKMTRNMDVADHLLLKGMKLIGSREKSTMERRKEQVMEAAGHFNKFQKFRKVVMHGGHPDSQRFGPIKKALRKISMISRTGKVLDKNFILGSLFEEYVFWLLEPLGFDDILCGAVVVMDEVEGGEVKNEFDILAIKENHLFIVECKMKDRIDGEMLVYKYDSLSGRLDADSKVMIVNVTSTPKATELSYKHSRNFNRGVVRRAILNGIFIYHEETLDPDLFQRTARRFFGLDGK